jgi:hypothetical protein
VRQNVPAPALSVQRFGTSIRICWPVAASDFALESASTLSAQPDWTPVEGEPTVDEDMICLELPATLPRQWFRLRK